MKEKSFIGKMPLMHHRSFKAQIICFTAIFWSFISSNGTFRIIVFDNRHSFLGRIIGSFTRVIERIGRRIGSKTAVFQSWVVSGTTQCAHDWSKLPRVRRVNLGPIMVRHITSFNDYNKKDMSVIFSSLNFCASFVDKVQPNLWCLNFAALLGR